MKSIIIEKMEKLFIVHDELTMRYDKLNRLIVENNETKRELIEIRNSINNKIIENLRKIESQKKY